MTTVKINLEERKKFKIPSIYQLPLELLGVVDFLKLGLNLQEVLNVSKGNGEKIIVIPGYASNDNYTVLLRKYLDHLGYKSQGWGLGYNHGDVPILLEQLNELIRNEFSKDNKKVILIGWSLGGYLAREVARDNQDKISKVVTFGSPVIGGPKYTSVVSRYNLGKYKSVDELENEIDLRYENPIQLPILSFYSKQDNIVSWQACIDPYSPNITHKEIESTHIGFLVHPEVYLNIAKFLQN